LHRRLSFHQRWRMQLDGVALPFCPGSARAWRACFGASPNALDREAHAFLKVRNGEGAIASTRKHVRSPEISSSNQSRGECTIKTVAERKGIFFRFQHQGRQLRKESTNNLSVFFALKTACAVNENSAGF
jgi:hypothetical protein